jgi:hypothetical protein
LVNVATESIPIIDILLVLAEKCWKVNDPMAKLEEIEELNSMIAICW